MTTEEYIEYLINEAKTVALSNLNKETPLEFDSQGRVLIDVRVPEEYKTHNGTGWIPSDVVLVRLDISQIPKLRDAYKKKLINSIYTEEVGIASDRITGPDETTYNPLPGDSGETTTSLEEKFKRYWENMPKKGSLISIQSEIHMNTSLAARAWAEKIWPMKPTPYTPDKFQPSADYKTKTKDEQKKEEADYKAAYYKEEKTKIRKKQDKIADELLASILPEINNLVLKRFAQILKDAPDPSDIGALNTELDKARDALASEAQKMLAEAILTSKEQEIQTASPTDSMNELNQIIKSISSPKELKKITKRTTATDRDILDTDDEGHTVKLTQGTNITAHHRVAGTETASRKTIVMHLSHDNPDQVESSVLDDQTHVRLSTPDDSDRYAWLPNWKSAADYEKDVVAKMEKITDDYFPDIQSTRKPKAFIYNRFTAFRHITDEVLKSNHQTLSTKTILFGLHRFNEKAAKTDSTQPFCFMEAISVNGKGHEIGYRTGVNKALNFDRLRPEVTLMAEMAMIHTLYEGMTEDEKAEADKVFNNYKTFLQSNANAKLYRNSYFSSTAEGKASIALISAIKESFQKNDNRKGIDTASLTGEQKFVNDASDSLRHLMGNDAHFKHENSVLIQTLSVFLEKDCATGCKSANEREEMIKARVNRLRVAAYRANKGWKFANSEQNPMRLSEEAKSGYKDKFVIHENKLYFVNCNLGVSEVKMKEGTKDSTLQSLLEALPDKFPEKLMENIEEESQPDEFVIQKALSELSQAPNNLNQDNDEVQKYRAKVTALDKAIDRANNNGGQQQSVISSTDQGMSYKIMARASGFFNKKAWNANYGEKESQTYLQQKHAGDWQAHKKLPAKMYESLMAAFKERVTKLKDEGQSKEAENTVNASKFDQSL